MEQEEDFVWSQIEHAYLFFLLTIDALGIAASIGPKLRSAYPTELYEFCERQRSHTPIKKIIVG